MHHRLIALALLVVAPAVATAQSTGTVKHQEAVSHYKDGQTAFAREDFAGAERAYKAALQSEPGFLLAHFALGQTYMAMKRFPDAVDAYTAAKRGVVEQNRQTVTGRNAAEQRSRDELRELRDSLQLLQTGTLKNVDPSKQARIEERIRTLEQEQNKGVAGVQDVPAEFSFALGTALLRTGNPKAAEQEYRDAIRVKPGYGDAHNNLAVVLAMQDRWAEAESELAIAEKAGFKVPPTLRTDIQRKHFSPPAAQPAAAPQVAVDDKPLEIAHEPVACVVVGGHPRIEARITPAAGVSRARVRFRTAHAADWYTVAMERDEETFFAVLPRPRKDLATFEYYIEATDSKLAERRSPEFTPVVRGRAEDCKGMRLAEFTATSAALVEAPAGAPAMPQGFDEPRRPKQQAEKRAGVFGLGPYTSLAAGAAVLGGSYAAVASVAHQDTTPLIMTLVASEPPAGGQAVVSRNPIVTLTFHIEPRRDFDGYILATMVPGFDRPFTNPSCQLSLRSDSTSFRNGVPQDIVARGNAVSCGVAGVELFTDRVDVRVLDNTSQTVFSTNGGSLGGVPSFKLTLGYILQ